MFLETIFGFIIRAFFHFYRMSTNMMGETMALLDRLMMTVDFRPLLMECDSSYIVDCVYARCASSWSIVYII